MSVVAGTFGASCDTWRERSNHLGVEAYHVEHSFVVAIFCRSAAMRSTCQILPRDPSRILVSLSSQFLYTENNTFSLQLTLGQRTSLVKLCHLIPCEYHVTIHR